MVGNMKMSNSEQQHRVVEDSMAQCLGDGVDVQESHGTNFAQST